MKTELPKEKQEKTECTTFEEVFEGIIQYAEQGLKNATVSEYAAIKTICQVMIGTNDPKLVLKKNELHNCKNRNTLKPKTKSEK